MTAAGRVGVSGNLLLRPGISLPQTDTDTTAMTAAGRAGVSVETYYCGRASGVLVDGVRTTAACAGGWCGRRRQVGRHRIRTACQHIPYCRTEMTMGQRVTGQVGQQIRVGHVGHGSGLVAR